MAAEKKELNELEALAAQAAQDDDLKPPSQVEAEKAAEANKPDAKQEAGAIVTLATETLVGAYPELATVYTPERNAKIADAFAYTFEYYGMTLGGFMGHPLFVLGAALLPVIPPTYRAATKPALKAPDQPQQAPATVMHEIKPESDPTDLFNKV